MNDKIEKKRIRGSNFTPEEELELIQNIINYQHIIESKELNASTRNEKDAAWNQIYQIFNAKFAPRTVHQLRSKYDNMKTLARRLITEKRNNIININSFNNANNIRSNIAMNIVLSIVSRKPENPNDNVIDCNPEDIQFSEESNSYSDASSKQNSLIISEQHVEPFNNFEIKVKTEEEIAENNYFDKNESVNITPVISILPRPSNKAIIINTPAEINKNLEKNKNLVMPTVNSTPSQNSNVPDNEDKSSDSTNQNRVVRKYRNPKFQTMLKVKTEYLKRKTELLELENEERIKRMKREEEMYAMKMKIMMLDISIKEAELKKLQRLNNY